MPTVILKKNGIKKNPEKNIYDDFFAEIFAQNAIEQSPISAEKAVIRINFKIPDTDLTIPMIQSGFGDGNYPVYFGYDKDHQLCDVVIEYIYLG